MSILRQGFGVFVTRVWAAAAGLIMSIIIARSFGPEGKGIASLMLLVPVLLSTFGNAGLHISNVYFFGKKGASISRLASNSVWVALVLGLLVCGVGIAFYPLVGDRFFAGVPGPFLFTIVALTPAMLLSAYFGNLLLAQRRIAVFNTVMAVQTGVQLATLMIAIYFFDAGVIAVVLGLVVNIIIGALGMTALVYRADPFTWTFDRPLFKQTMLYGLKGYVANALQFLNYRSDILLVSFFLGATAVGWYSVAVNFAEILWYVPTSLGTILFPVVASSSIANATKTTARTSRQTIFLMTLASAGVALVSPWIIPRLYGAEFEPSVMALLVLLPGVLIFSVAKIIGNDFSGRGLVLTNSVVSGLALLVNVGLNLLLIPQYGIIGASLASTITYTLATAALVILFSRYTKAPIARVVLPENDDLKDLVRSLRRIKKKTSTP